MTIPAGPNGGFRLSDLTSSLASVQAAREAANRNVVPVRAQIGRQYKSVRKALPGQFARRGMVNSGIGKQAYAKSYVDEARERDAVTQQLNDLMEQLFLQQQTAENAYATYAGEDALTEYLNRAAVAANIREAG